MIFLVLKINHFQYLHTISSKKKGIGMSRSSSSNQNHHAMWKKLIDMGLFDESYAQRVNASFQYLCPDAESNSFSLKDLIHHGNAILPYLNLDVEKDSNFAMMDLFRLFDRSGKGNVYIEDFVLGIIEKVNLLHEDNDLLQHIAEHMLQVESRCIELATLLEKSALLVNEHFAKFNVHLKAHSHQIRYFIRAMKTQNHHLSALDRDTLVNIFKMSLALAVKEMQQYFRLSNSRLQKLVTKPVYLTDNTVLAQVQGKSARSLWALVTPNSNYTANNTNNNSSITNSITYVLNSDQLQNSQNNNSLLSSFANSSNLNNLNGNATNHLTATNLSSKDDLSSSSTDHLMFNNSSNNHASKGILSEKNKASLFASANIGESTLGELLQDIQATQLLPIDLTNALHREVIEDSSQLHLLQDALLSLNNLFTLRCFTQPGNGAAQALFTTMNSDAANVMKEENLFSLPPTDNFTPIVRHPVTQSAANTASLSTTFKNQYHSLTNFSNNSNDNSSDYETLLQRELLKKVHHFRDVLHQSTSNSTNSNTTLAKTPTTNNSSVAVCVPEESVLENALLMQLLQTQEELLRCQRRLSVMELLQTHVVSETALNQTLLNNQNFNANINSSNNRNSPSAEDMVKKFLPFHSSDNNPNNSKENKRRKALLSAAHTVNSLPFFNNNNSNNANNSNNNNNPTNTVVDSFSLLVTNQDETSFDHILQELHLLGAALAERASETHSLGVLLDGGSSIALLDTRQHKLPPTIFLNNNATSTNPPPTNNSNSLNNSANNNTGSNVINAAKNGKDNNAVNGKDNGLQNKDNNNVNSNNANDNPLSLLLNNLDFFAKDLHEEMKRRVDVSVFKEAQQHELKQSEQRAHEQQLTMEQAEFERNEFLALTVEMQVLREKAQKIARDENHMKNMEQRNSELTKKIKDLEEQVSQLLAAQQQQQQQQVPFSPNNGSVNANNRTPTHVHGKSNVSLLNNSNNPNNSTHSNQSNQQLADLQKRFEEKSNDFEHVVKENQRLKSANKVSEQRLKSALQDQMSLHSQIQSLEEENMTHKTTITKLTRELEEQRSLRAFKEDAERKMFDLQKEISKKDVEFCEAKETASLANKYHSDLIAAERVIENLEQKVAEYSVELEKGSVAMNQLENYREQLRHKTKEIRDLSLHIHALESQLKDVGYLQHRVHELSEELQDTKIKGEKIPGLLAEISRLRGGTRASIKALAEQDKLLHALKQRVKNLEKENALLRNDNKALQDVELKLKDSHAEVKRLLTLVNEVQATKQNSLRNAEEEKKSMENQYKKMRKFMHQSVLINHNASSANLNNHGSNSSSQYDMGDHSPTPSGQNNNNS